MIPLGLKPLWLESLGLKMPLGSDLTLSCLLHRGDENRKLQIIMIRIIGPHCIREEPSITGVSGDDVLGAESLAMDDEP